MKIAPAHPSDAARLATILFEWADETPWMPKLHDVEDTTQFLHRLIDTMDVLTIRSWRQAGGFMARDGAEIHALYLAPSRRGQGWGTQLIERAKSQAPKLALWTFQANDRARKFYARHGFVEVETTDGQGNDEKLPDVRLEWRRAA